MTDDPFERIAALDQQFGFLEARSASLGIDRAQAAADGPLASMVIGAKSNIAVAGQVWTAGMSEAYRPLAEADASVVAALRNSGARILSRLKMDEAALGASTENPHFGRAENPARIGYSTGGSSGGSAGAVACGAVPVALGSDTLGSVRIPAAYCGVVGLKPAPGLLPHEGVFPLAPAFDAVGLLGRNVEDLHGVWSAVVPEQELAALELVVPGPSADIPLSDAVGDGFARVCDAARALGFLSDQPALDTWDPVQTRKDAFATVAHTAHMHLSGLDGHSLGLRAALDYGVGQSEARLAAAATRLAALRDALNDTFARGCVLLTPTVPAEAFWAGARPPSDQATFTALANIAGAASLAVPIPGEGPPVSFLLTGGAGTERTLLTLGDALYRQLSPA